MAGGLFNLGSWQNLDNDTMTNLFLYGDKTTPQEIFDRIRSPDTPPTVVQLDMNPFMTDGPGRYAKASLAPFVTKFFDFFFKGVSDPLLQSLQNLRDTVTVGNLIEKY